MPSAILFSKVDAVAGRFPDALPEFHAFLSQQGIATGDPDALPALAENIAAGGDFREQLASMVNVVCLLEDKVSYLELLGLLLVAAAGQESADELAGMPAFEEPVREIFNFVVEVKRTRQETDEAALANDDVDNLPEPGQGNAPAIEPPTTPLLDHPPADPSELPPVRERGSVLARALAVSADEAEFGDRRPKAPEEPDAFDAARLGRTPRPSPTTQTPPEPPPELAASSLDPAPTPTPISSAPFARPLFTSQPEPQPSTFPRWAAWALAACGILLGFLLGLLWHRSSPTPSPATQQTSAAAENASASRHRTRTPHHDAPVPTPAPAPAPAPALEATRPAPAWDDSFIAESEIPPTPHTRARHTSSAATGSTRPAPASTRSSNAADLAHRAAVSPAPPRVGTVNLNSPPDPTYSQPGRNAHLPSVVTGTSGIMAANLISSPAPAYPARATAQNVQGEVIIEATVGRDGSVTDTRVVSGPELLRDAALHAVQNWRFRPYEVDGAPAEISTLARLEFRLPRP